MKYAYPINIVREPKMVRFVIKHVLPDDMLTLDILRKYVNEGETFSLTEVQYQFDSDVVLTIHGKRLETQVEFDTRIRKQEKYMESYYKYQSKKE